MISKATDHKATVLMNRRMKTERRVATFGPVCSSVAGTALHHPEGRHGVQEGSASVSDEYATLSRIVIWSSLISPAMDRARDERISGESNQSSAHCDAKSQMAQSATTWLASRNVAECNFDCRNVRVYRGGPGASPDFR